ncbi:thiol reductant ABC exporter subunit CydD [uncultured Brevundimonas sp.]|uniref:thiol reductant ABC exporter subunit CydD n=1 Tax=uncultured Brevundimonas sp. TaxID=213418 RepID=UPI002607E499|nr:thiol reductant ABC exporter subunit CydD [uncultured Brevundimonas sp.]
MTDTLPDSRATARWLKTATADWKRPVATVSVLTMADAVPAVAFAAGLGWAMGSAVDAVGEGLSMLAAVAPGAGLSVAALLLRGALAQITAGRAAKVAMQVKNGLRQRLAPAVLSGRLSDAAAMTGFVEAVDALDGYFAKFAPSRTAAAIVPLILIAAAAVVSPFAAGILLFTLIPFVLGMALTGMAAAKESRRQFVAMERLSGLFLDRIRALPAILTFEAETQQTGIIARASTQLAQRTSKVLKVAFLSSAILEFFSALSVALVAVYCGFNLLKILPFPAPDSLTLGKAFFLLALAPEVYQPMRRLAAAYHERQAADSAVPSLQALSDATSEVAPQPLKLKAAPVIRFENVSIRYDQNLPAVENVSLALDIGETVALMGPSGSGKSSLLHSLMGLAPISAGRITVDGTPLGPHIDLVPSIAYAGQAPMVIPGTIEDNIRLAWPAASTRQIMEAAVKAGLKGDLSRMVDERGGGLSGGERRRLGLARAFLKPSAILILDEPTAHLDRASEDALLPILRQAIAGRTTLIATHSEQVAKLAHQVVTL